MADEVAIDGSRGEGGGQILRTALALALLTRRPLRMRRIRAGRAKPGLQRQHLACVLAAARLSGAHVEGAELGSTSLAFAPSEARVPHLEIDIGTAGSTTLVLQTILVPAIASGEALHVEVSGGTHNPMAPPADFLARVFLPHLRAMGADVELAIARHGLAPKGGGRLVLDVRAGGALRPIDIVEGGDVVARHAIAIVAGLPRHIAERELAVARDRMGVPPECCEVRELERSGPGNLLMLEVERASGARELVTGFGERGTRAELVASRACDELAAYIASGAPVGVHLADQLLLPLAVAGGGRFRAAPLSRHATTNIETIAQFLAVPVRVEQVPAGLVDVVVG